MKLSISESNSIFKPIEANGLKSVEHIITKYTYSFATFKNNERKSINFERAYAFGLDFDGGMTLELAKKNFDHYKHIIAPTRSHQKMKNGIKCDRFRVILFFEEPVDSSVLYRSTVKEFLRIYPEADKACSDAARMFYPSTSIYSSGEGELVPPYEYIKAVKTEQPKKIPVIDYSEKPDGFTNCKWAIANGLFNSGESNEALLSLVTHMKGLGYTKEMAYYMCKNALEKREEINGASWDKDELWRTKIEYIYGDDFGNVKYNCRTEGTWLHEYCNNLGEHACSKRKNQFSTMDTVQGFLNQKREEKEWVVNKLFATHSTTILAGPPKKGKSTLVRQLIAATKDGGYFLGQSVKPTNVGYFALEEEPGLIDIQLRILKLEQHKNCKIWIGAPSEPQHFIDDLEEMIISNNFGLVVIDPMTDAMPIEDINSYTLVRETYNKFRDVARKTGAHILFIHHTNKGAMYGQNSIMGSQGFASASDGNLIFYDDNDKRYISGIIRGGIRFSNVELEFDERLHTYSIVTRRKKENEEF